MTEQENEDDIFSDPHPIAECQDDVALCFIPEPDEETGASGFWEALQRVEDGAWVNERCVLRRPSHFIPMAKLLAKYPTARPASVHRTYPFSEVPPLLQAVEFFDIGSAAREFEYGRLRPGQLFAVDAVQMEFDATGNVIHFN